MMNINQAPWSSPCRWPDCQRQRAPRRKRRLRSHRVFCVGFRALWIGCPSGDGRRVLVTQRSFSTRNLVKSVRTSEQQASYDLDISYHGPVSSETPSPRAPNYESKIQRLKDSTLVSRQQAALTRSPALLLVKLNAILYNL